MDKLIHDFTLGICVVVYATVLGTLIYFVIQRFTQ